MGRQVGFYMTVADEFDFLKFLHKNPSIQVLSVNAVPNVEFIDDLSTASISNARKVLLWNKSISNCPAVTRFNGSSDGYIDALTEEVVEFMRSNIEDRRLFRGRIWMSATFWDPIEYESLKHKTHQFEKWYEQLARWIKKKSVGHHEGCCILPGASAFIEQGGWLA